MKHRSRIAICLAGGLILQTNARGLTPEGNPYLAIVKQNVFRLKSPPTEQPRPPEAPPKITLLGIVSAPGSKQVMFKTLIGTPPREISYVLGEDEGADEIEVIRINEITGSVCIRNRGLEQTLSLEKDGMKPGGGHAVATSSAAKISFRDPSATRAIATPFPQPGKPVMSAEEQTIIMELNRKLSAGQVDRGELPPLPPTPITGN